MDGHGDVILATPSDAEEGGASDAGVILSEPEIESPKPGVGRRAGRPRPVPTHARFGIWISGCRPSTASSSSAGADPLSAPAERCCVKGLGICEWQFLPRVADDEGASSGPRASGSARVCGCGHCTDFRIVRDNIRAFLSCAKHIYIYVYNYYVSFSDTF